MADWFAPKRYGLGAGLPIAWQGWALTAAMVAIVTFAGVILKNKPLAAASVIVPALVLFLVIVARTTRGGWRWRWGDEENGS